MKHFAYLFFVTVLLSLPLAAQDATPENAPNEQQDSTSTTQGSAEDGAEGGSPENKEQGTPTDSSQQAIEIRPPAPIVEQFEQDITRAIDKSLVSPLLAGTEDFLTITQPDLHRADKGVAILLPEWSQAATDAKAINFLRQHLPDQGWTTIAVQPIAKPSNYPSLAEKPEIARQDNEKALQDYQEKLKPLLGAVMDKAADYPGIFLVIAQGNNAAILLDLYRNDGVVKPNAFIALSAHMLTVEDNQMLANKMAASELPILDIVLKRDVNWVEYFAPLRKKTAQKELKPYYRQRVLTNFRTAYYPEQHLAKEIKGWLTSIGW